MKKTLSKILIFLLCFQLITPNFLINKTYAENATRKCENNEPVCSATPDSLSIYLEFQKEMANLLSKNGFKTATETMEEGGAGLFTSKMLQLTGLQTFNNSLAGQSLRIFDITVTRSATAIITATFLFELAAVGALADNTIGLSVLFQERPIVRDRMKLLDVERSLNTAAYELWRAWEIAKTVVEMEKINAIIKKYVDKGLFTEGSQFKSWRYMDIIMELVELNATMKRFLIYDDSNPISEYKDNWHTIWIKKERYTKIEDDYKCTRPKYWLKCNTSRAALKNNLKILTNNTKKQGQWSIKQIKKAYQDLMESVGHWWALKSNIQWKANKSQLSEREILLLKGRYGLNTNRITEQDWTSILSINSNIKEQWKKLTKTVNATVKAVKWTISNVKASKQEYNNKKCYDMCWDNLKSEKCKKYIEKNNSRCKEGLEKKDPDILKYSITAKSNQYSWTKLARRLSEAYKNLEISKNNIKRIAAMTMSAPLTKDFRIYSKKIDKIWEQTIGDAKKGLRQAMKEVCEKQCTNKDSECCYMP